MEGVIELAMENVYITAATAVVGLLVIVAVFRALGGASSGERTVSARDQIHSQWARPLEHAGKEVAEMVALARSMTATLEDRTRHVPGVLDDFMFNPSVGTEARVAVVTKKKFLGAVQPPAASGAALAAFSRQLTELLEDEVTGPVAAGAEARLAKAKRAADVQRAFGEYLAALEDGECVMGAMWKCLRPGVVLPAAFILSERVGRVGDDVRFASLEAPAAWDVEVDMTKRTAGTVDGDSGEIKVVHLRRDAVVRGDDRVAEVVWSVTLTMDSNVSYPMDIRAAVREIHVLTDADEDLVDQLEKNLRVPL